jgi:hypothetical protein
MAEFFSDHQRDTHSVVVVFDGSKLARNGRQMLRYHAAARAGKKVQCMIRDLRDSSIYGLGGMAK